MARRIRWQIVIALMSSVLVLGMMGYLAISTAAVQRPVEGGAYVEGLLYAPQQINPLIGNPATDQGAADLQALVFDGLVRVGDDGLPEPALARGWDVDATGTVYTFVLRDGVRWHDGTPLSVADVLFTIRAIQGPAFAGNPSLRAIWSGVTVEQIDQQTILCQLEAPFAAFLEYASFPILPAHLFENLPPEQWSASPFATRPVGTGPYQVVELSSKRAVLQANPSYFQGRPFIESLELRYYSAAEPALSDLISGNIQGLSYSSSNDLRNANLPRTLVRRSAALDGYTILTFNLREGPLADQAVRRALAVGLNRQELVNQVLDGQAGQLDTPILPQWWAAAPEVGWPAASSERANQLLDELGYLRGSDGLRSKDGVPLAITILTDGASDRLATAQEIMRQWSMLGVSVQVEQVDEAALQQRLGEHRFMVGIHAWQRLGADPDVYALWHSDQAEAGRNYAGLQDEQIDELLTQARQESDLDARYAAYSAFQRRFIELAPAIPLYQPRLFYVATSELRGVALDSDENPESLGRKLLVGRESRFANITRWFLRSAREIQGDLRQP